MANEQYQQLLKQFVNTDYDQLLNIANRAAKRVIPKLNEVAKNGNGASLFVPVICTAIASDGRFTQLEYQFIKDLTNSNMSFEEFKGVIQKYHSKEWADAVNQAINSISGQLRADLLTICLCFVAVDETITREENEYIAKLMN